MKRQIRYEQLRSLPARFIGSLAQHQNFASYHEPSPTRTQTNPTLLRLTRCRRAQRPFLEWVWARQFGQGENPPSLDSF
jgi:hypothetical protein